MKIADNPEAYVKIDPITKCWIWQAGLMNGYGTFRINGNGPHIYAHIYFYEKKYGKILHKRPYNILDHIVCNNRKCCNPDHVKPSCLAKNMNRPRQERIFCKKGHLLINHKCEICRRERINRHNIYFGAYYRKLRKHG